jgi:hypothetical protein
MIAPFFGCKWGDRCFSKGAITGIVESGDCMLKKKGDRRLTTTVMGSVATYYAGKASGIA